MVDKVKIWDVTKHMYELPQTIDNSMWKLSSFYLTSKGVRMYYPIPTYRILAGTKAVQWNDAICTQVVHSNAGHFYSFRYIETWFCRCCDEVAYSFKDTFHADTLLRCTNLNCWRRKDKRTPGAHCTCNANDRFSPSTGWNILRWGDD